jgi:Holliday junction DNA helicase RuvA
MIDYIKGTLARKEDTVITVEAAGVGYEIWVPLSTYSRLPEVAHTVTVLIYFHVREDIHRLYGFATEPERHIFKSVIGINKIGPKVGLSILSQLSVAHIVESVRTGEASWFASVSGIGPKTAQRIVMELKDRLDIHCDTGALPAGSTEDAGADSAIRKEAFAALCALGYNEKQVQQALRQTAAEIETGASVEQWVRRGLQHI